MKVVSTNQSGCINYELTRKVEKIAKINKDKNKENKQKDNNNIFNKYI